jgi:hypothetical protein
MPYGRIALLAAWALGSSFAHRAHALDDPFGFYVGGALGLANVRADETAFGGPLEFKQRHNAWQVLLGLRPIPLVGAELEYLDFGHPHAETSLPNAINTGVRTDAHPRATALFGVIYAPIPVPLLDIYGKLGVARLRTAVNASLYCTAGPCGVGTFVAPFALSRTDTRLAYGAGMQFRFAAFAGRMEYERINSGGGDPDLVSLGFTWSF